MNERVYTVLRKRCTDTSDPRHFGTSAELSVRHIGTGAEVSRHIGTVGAEVSGHFGTDLVQIITLLFIRCFFIRENLLDWCLS